jgi:lambda family phage tail tape measure protein
MSQTAELKLRISVTGDDAQARLRSIQDELKRLEATSGGGFKADFLDKMTDQASAAGNSLKDLAGRAIETGAAAGGASSQVASMASRLLVAAGVFGIAAAGVGALGFAYHQGAAESDKLNAALILSGNAAGVTLGQLNQYGQAVSAASGATQGFAAQALEQLAASGRVSGEVMVQAATAAVELQRAGGPAVKETAKAFEELAGNPWAAVVKLNAGTNFLTTSLVEQIKTLDEQGRSAEAAKVAQEAYAEALKTRAAELSMSLGALEKLWMGTADAAKGAWDAMMGLGRSSTVEEQLLRAQANVASLSRDRRGWFGESLNDPQERSDWQQEAARLQAQVDQAQAAAIAEGKRAEQVKARIQWEQEGQKYLSKEGQLRQEITRIRNEGAAAGIAQVAIEQRVAAAMRKGERPFAPTKSRQPLIDLADLAAQGKLIQTALKDQLDDIDSLAKRQEISAEEALAQRFTARNEALVKQIALLDRELSVKNLDPVKKQQLTGQRNDLAAQQIGLEKANGRNQLELQFTQALEAAAAWSVLIDPINSATAALSRQNDERGKTVEQLAQEKLALLENAEANSGQTGVYDGLINAQRQYVAELQRAAAYQADWKNGMNEAVTDFSAKAADVAGQVKSSMLASFDSISGALANFVATGKGSFKSLASSIISEMARAYANKAVSSLLGMAVSAISSYFSPSSASNPEFMSYGQNYDANAKGNVFESSSLHRYVNTVQSQPTYFAFAQGGVFAEAGPEAVMPLTRAADGSLGVRATGGGGGGDTVISITVNADGSRTQGDNGDSRGSQLAGLLEGAVMSIIVREKRPGGLLAA